MGVICIQSLETKVILMVNFHTVIFLNGEVQVKVGNKQFVSKSTLLYNSIYTAVHIHNKCMQKKESEIEKGR